MLKIIKKTHTSLIITLMIALTMLSITTYIAPVIHNNPIMTSSKGIKLVKIIFLKYLQLRKQRA